jgi:hypothetical protein
MGGRNGLVSAALVMLCAGILVLFTDIEISARWWICRVVPGTCAAIFREQPMDGSSPGLPARLPRDRQQGP